MRCTTPYARIPIWVYPAALGFVPMTVALEDGAAANGATRELWITSTTNTR